MPHVHSRAVARHFIKIAQKKNSCKLKSHPPNPSLWKKKKKKINSPLGQLSTQGQNCLSVKRAEGVGTGYQISRPSSYPPSIPGEKKRYHPQQITPPIRVCPSWADVHLPLPFHQNNNRQPGDHCCSLGLPMNLPQSCLCV